MRKSFLFSLLAFLFTLSVQAQRPTDSLDRGLVAVELKSGVFVSWRVQSDEYYGVTYNLYRDGVKLNEQPLSVSNYTDASGRAGNSYSVRAVVNGVEQAACTPVQPWTTGRIDTSNKVPFPCPAYKYIRMKDVVDRTGTTVWSASTGTPVFTQNYTLNDVSLGDLNGDGRIDLLVKRINQTDADNGYLEANTTAYTILEAYELDGNRLWWIDCGPNMVSMNCTELNAVCYDWDEDGKAEVLLRGADNMIIHMADGATYPVGNAAVNTRGALSTHTNAQYEWTHTGAEYLIYLNGQTGRPYWVKDYPLPRLESGESSEKSAWGDDYGHRSSKYFMGAPFLDGRHASIFLARGIYTRHKMIAYDVNPSTHELTERWRWTCNTSGSPWYGQGNHNYSVADVDGDGCDEIIYGSMVIDNNGRGLSTTGLGHGDALHVGDLDPFRKGMEVFACNEDKPNNNYRNATTSELYYRDIGTGDDGRAMAGNFTNNYPGSIGMSTQPSVISLAADQTIEGWVNNWNDRTPDPAALNFRIYWDGDLLDESVNSPGTERECIVLKAGYGRLIQTGGVAMTNDSKNNPCAQGDILGDWREELILRSTDNAELRIYTTTDATVYRMPSLWYDHAYRQAMVWQPLGYNQPPHVSYFVGEMEDLTVAPPPLTNSGRKELAANGVITSASDGQHVMVCDGGNIGIDEGGVSPAVLTMNVRSTVSGNDNNANISYSYSTCQLGATINGTTYKGDLTGAMRLIKQGDGLLKLTARTFTYTGPTDIWAGSVYFRGTLESSPVWMNRHTSLYTAAIYHRALTMEYGAALYPSYNATTATALDYATATIDTLNLHEGARVVLQLSAGESDAIVVRQLNLRKRSWSYGPKYLAPVFEIRSTTPLADGMYRLGTLQAVGQGSLEDIVIECPNLLNSASDLRIVCENSKLYLVVGEYVEPDERDTSFYEMVYELDFEQESADNYGFRIAAGGVGVMRRETLSDESHYFHIYLDNNNDRIVNLSLADNPLFATANDYQFEFDLAWVGSNQNASTTTVIGSNGTLFTITLGAWASEATVTDMNGQAIGTFAVSPYVKNVTLSADYQPAQWNHFVVTANADEGVLLSVYHEGVPVMDKVQISPTFDTVASISNKLGRYYSHVGFDNLRLSYKCAGLGDVNLDGVITIADVTALVNIILGNSSAICSQKAADVNEDGTTTIADVTALVNKILAR
ncbi:MAG: rhamnogalacturonan lyase [Bacteroidaceae bacterium]|nr:rhamnogalacturonan lyase [Bacteroidaceae bacterium]